MKPQKLFPFGNDSNFFRIIFLLTMTLGASLNSNAQSKYAGYAVKPFQDLDFKPHVYLDKDLIKAYGPGNTIKVDGYTYRSYLDEKSGLWVNFRSDPDLSSDYRYVSEVFIGKIGTGRAVSPSVSMLSQASLFGVSVGDSKAKSLRVANTKNGFRSGESNYLNKKFTELEFFSSDPGSNAYYKYLTSDSCVVGIIIGVSD